jgi:UDP-GlcNAc:undecaprenyl-phosphate GlcNAc-1-phosphate transferase
MTHGLPPAVLYPAAFVLSLLVTWVLTPLFGRLATRLGVLDHPAENKFHQEATPYLGGAAVGLSLVLVGGVGTGASAQLVTLLLGGVALGLLGLADDRAHVKPVVKLVVEVGAAAALWLVGIRAGLFGVALLDFGLTVLWVVAITNAINMLDNMDGLSSGVTAIAAMAFFAIAAQRGDYLVGALALAVAGASIGFLRYNFPPARIFLGDAGTLLLGFLLAALGLKLDLVGENGVMRSAVPVLLLGVPIFDMALVVVARLRDGRRIYVGGTDHTSHRLVALGFSTRAVAFFAYGAQILCAATAVWLLGASAGTGLTAIVGAGVVAVGVLIVLLALPTEQRAALIIHEGNGAVGVDLGGEIAPLQPRLSSN